MRFPRRPLTLGPILAILAGCATTQAPAPAPLVAPEVPQALRAPAGQTLYLEALATGVQIYECSQKADGTYEWAFKAPEAALADRSGRAIGKHYAGPTWEAPDGSAVVGEVKARDSGPKPTAIPWLLLSAKSTRGSGVFTDAKSIQRIATDGGTAPSTPCTDARLKEVARVPYTAT